MTVFKDTSKLAAAAVVLMDQLIKGTALNAAQVPGAILAPAQDPIANTGNGYGTTYLLDPILITKDNLNTVIDAGFYSDDELSQYGLK
jgi:ABC-type xylose transport system substrate-binding protein